MLDVALDDLGRRALQRLVDDPVQRRRQLIGEQPGQPGPQVVEPVIRSGGEPSQTDANRPLGEGRIGGGKDRADDGAEMPVQPDPGEGGLQTRAAA